MGGFNARIGEKNEEGIIFGYETFLKKIMNEKKWGVMKEIRKSNDKHLNQQGKTLVKLCRDEGLIVLNGRCPGDIEGEITYLEPMGVSVIDYIIVGWGLVKEIREMKVGLRTESSHMPLEFILHKKKKKEIKKLKEKETTCKGKEKN